MEFKLSNEQIDEIIELYGGSRRLITEVQNRVNMLEIIKDEEEFYETIIDIISEIESYKTDAQAQNKEKAIYNMDDVIKKVLVYRYMENDEVMDIFHNGFKR